MPANLSGAHFKIIGIVLHVAIYKLYMFNAIVARSK